MILKLMPSSVISSTLWLVIKACKSFRVMVVAAPFYVLYALINYANVTVEAETMEVVFIEAARCLDMPPADCLVFEDAPMGIVAAQAAGMPVVALTTSFNAAHFAGLQPPPTATCVDFDVFLERHFA